MAKAVKKKRKSGKLILFDIDGTLLSTNARSVGQWNILLQQVFAKVYVPLPEFDERKLNGKLERKYFGELAAMAGIPRAEFEKKFSLAVSVFADLFIEAIDTKRFELDRIAGAYELVTALRSSSVSLGLITGNNEPVAWHKLRAVDFDKQFSFGVWGHEVEDRGELVLLGINRASEHFSTDFSPRDTIIVGDTRHDIAAAKYAGAYALGVTTGHTDTRADLEQAGADLVVDSLMDEQVRIFMGESI